MSKGSSKGILAEIAADRTTFEHCSIQRTNVYHPPLPTDRDRQPLRSTGHAHPLRTDVRQPATATIMTRNSRSLRRSGVGLHVPSSVALPLGTAVSRGWRKDLQRSMSQAAMPCSGSRTVVCRMISSALTPGKHDQSPDSTSAVDAHAPNRSTHGRSTLSDYQRSPPPHPPSAMINIPRARSISFSAATSFANRTSSASRCSRSASCSSTFTSSSWSVGGKSAPAIAPVR